MVETRLFTYCTVDALKGKELVKNVECGIHRFNHFCMISHTMNI